MKFIKLHNVEDNSVIIVNGDNIITVEKDGNETVIYCIKDNAVSVHESPEKIFSMLTT